MSRRLLPALAALGFLACQGKLLTISIEDSAETEVDKGTLLEDLVGDLGFGDFLDMDITGYEELQNQGVQPGDIKEVYLTDFRLTATAPDGADLSFLGSMDLYVEAPGLDRERVAWADSFPEGQAEVVFNLEDVDLTDYVVSQSMTLTTEITGHRPDTTTTVEAGFALDVGVTAQGACNQAKKN